DRDVEEVPRVHRGSWRVEADRRERRLVPLARDGLWRPQQGDALTAGVVAQGHGPAADATVALLTRAGVEDTVAADGALGDERPPLGRAPADDEHPRQHGAGGVYRRLQVHPPRQANAPSPSGLDGGAPLRGRE